MSKAEELWMLVEETQGRIAAEIRIMLGEAPIEVHNFTPANQRRRIETMQQCANNYTTDEERHDDWIRKHESEGWHYGEVFDAALKTHPNLMPWNDLPSEVRSKARIFHIMSRLGKELEMLLSEPIPGTPPDMS